jgi:hypothetical protein
LEEDRRLSTHSLSTQVAQRKKAQGGVPERSMEEGAPFWVRITQPAQGVRREIYDTRLPRCAGPVLPPPKTLCVLCTLCLFGLHPRYMGTPCPPGEEGGTRYGPRKGPGWWQYRASPQEGRVRTPGLEEEAKKNKAQGGVQTKIRLKGECMGYKRHRRSWTPSLGGG